MRRTVTSAPHDRRRRAAPPEAADDAAVVDRLAAIVNRAYAVGEEGIWLPGTDRIGANAVAAAIRAGELLGATLDGALVGCGRAVMLDATTGASGSCRRRPRPGARASGARCAGGGGAAGRARRNRDAARAARAARLGAAAQARLRGWYERLGYRVVRTAPFGEIAAPGADRLAGPADFLIFRKPLQPFGGSERA